MGSSFKCWKVSFYSSLLLVGMVWLLLVGALHMEEVTTKTTNAHLRSRGSIQIHDKKQPANVHTDINFMSKRKVPNGPDPIHNRRAGNSRRSPGRTYRGEFEKP